MPLSPTSAAAYLVAVPPQRCLSGVAPQPSGGDTITIISPSHDRASPASSWEPVDEGHPWIFPQPYGSPRPLAEARCQGTCTGSSPAAEATFRPPPKVGAPPTLPSFGGCSDRYSLSSPGRRAYEGDYGRPQMMTPRFAASDGGGTSTPAWPPFNLDASCRTLAASEKTEENPQEAVFWEEVSPMGAPAHSVNAFACMAPEEVPGHAHTLNRVQDMEAGLLPKIGVHRQVSAELPSTASFVPSTALVRQQSAPSKIDNFAN